MKYTADSKLVRHEIESTLTENSQTISLYRSFANVVERTAYI